MQQESWNRRQRYLAIVIALLLALNSIGGMVATAAAPMSVTVQTPTAPIVAGSVASLTVNVDAPEAMALLVDLEIFEAASLTKVYQSFTDNVRAEAGQPLSVPFAWRVPASLAAGHYVVSVGIFGAGWNGMHGWYAGIGQLEVTAGTSNPGLPAPANVKATPAVEGVTLTWDAVAGAGAYDVEADGVLWPNVPNLSYEHSGLQPNSEHTYRVRAKLGNETGAWSSAVTTRTLPAEGEPDPSSSLKVQVKTGSNASTQMPTPELDIFNASDSPIELSTVKARYYFTIDEAKPLSIGFWTTVPKEAVDARFITMPVPSEQADHYLEISFGPGAGMLQPGAKAGVYTWINKSDWSSFTQTNDYSYNASAASVDNAKATAYVNGVLAWGTEPVLLDIPAAPAGLGGKPTDTTIRLDWEPVTGATGYDVDADGTIIENVSEPTYADEWLSPGTRHQYKVRTRKDEKLSVWSGAISVRTTGEQNLPAPGNVRGKTTENSITITWAPLEESITGYEVESDGQIIDLGMATSYEHGNLASGTKHSYRIRAVDGATRGAWSAPLTTNTIFTPTGTFDVQFTVDTNEDRAPISSYIYGTNDDLTGTENWGARRMGGNRMSTYNWENNASNAGDDYFHMSDDYVPWFYGEVPWGGNMNEPGIGVAGFHQKSLSMGAYTLTTLQTAGYVARDKNGTVTASETAPSSRWVPVVAAKNAPFSLTPDTGDNAVYMDEFVNALTSRFGGASTPTGIKGYEIDNEPSLWQHTHPYMHPEKPGAAEVVNKGIELAKAVKNVDPNAELFGPAAYSFDELHSMHAADDWNALKGSYAWYMDYYLDKFRIASAQEGKRLLDAVDYHWYPEISAGGYRITDAASYGNLEANLARMQAPRSLWDPTYTENSWIGQWYSSFLPILPRTQQSIDKYNPGTKIAITEYNYGGEDNVYGGVAQADVLGIFGKTGVYLATFWKMYNHLEFAPYVSAAVKLYTNYDGNGGRFGDTKVRAETSNIENSSIYGSVFKDSDDQLHLIVMNKNNDFDMNAVIDIAGDTSYSSARVFAFDETSSEITERQGVSGISGNSFSYTLPKLTVAHIVLTK